MIFHPKIYFPPGFNFWGSGRYLLPSHHVFSTVKPYSGCISRHFHI